MTCAAHWYGQMCDNHCVEGEGNYRCDPETGDKICHYGMYWWYVVVACTGIRYWQHICAASRKHKKLTHYMFNVGSAS